MRPSPTAASARTPTGRSTSRRNNRAVTGRHPYESVTTSGPAAATTSGAKYTGCHKDRRGGGANSRARSPKNSGAATATPATHGFWTRRARPLFGATTGPRTRHSYTRVTTIAPNKTGPSPESYYSDNGSKGGKPSTYGLAARAGRRRSSRRPTGSPRWYNGAGKCATENGCTPGATGKNKSGAKWSPERIWSTSTSSSASSSGHGTDGGNQTIIVKETAAAIGARSEDTVGPP